MSDLQILVLAIVEGITEFLPISSSGHLIVTSRVFGWPDQGLLFDIAVHVGTLAAVVAYCWRDVVAMLIGLRDLLAARMTPGARLLINFLVASIPIVPAGYFAKDLIATTLRDPLLIASTSIGFGIVLYLADRLAGQQRRLGDLGPGAALLIGCVKVLSLVPGTSRSGITITAARVLGYERRDAARFSMLLAIPTIVGAGALGALDIAEAQDAALTRDAVLGAAVSFVAAFAAILGMMAWLRRASYTPFVVYRIAFGAFLFAWFW